MQMLFSFESNKGEDSGLPYHDNNNDKYCVKGWEPVTDLQSDLTLDPGHCTILLTGLTYLMNLNIDINGTQKDVW